MYKIIGADGSEYGPVSIDQVRRWIAEGRADAQTKVQIEGGEWKTLSESPEFDADLAAKAVAASAPPKVAATEAERIAADVIARDYSIYIGDCFSRGWQLVKKNFWLAVGATAVMILLSFALGSIPIVGPLADLALTFVLWGGLAWMFLKLVRGQAADMNDAFAGFSLAFVPLMLASIVVQLLTAVGFVLCILPGVYLFVAWWGFTSLLILDKKLDFWPAMELSRKVVHKHWWQVFGLVILIVLVTLAGALALVVGLFFTTPIAVAASVYAYEDVFGDRSPAVVLAAPAATMAEIAGPPTGSPAQ
jgi:uncharacterized membrane protein